MIRGGMSRDTARFLDQNDLAALTLHPDDVEGFAEHHSGGLYVMFGYAADGRCVKMHDSWGDTDVVVVHTYDPDISDDPEERVEEFTSGSGALIRFLQLIRS